MGLEEHNPIFRLHTEAGVKERFCKDVREVTAAIMKVKY